MECTIPMDPALKTEDAYTYQQAQAQDLGLDFRLSGAPNSVSVGSGDEACFGWKLAVAAVPQPPISTLGTRPMAPATRHPPRRTDAQQPVQPAADDASAEGTNDELFLDPMMGTPLAIYIEKDVEDRDNLVEIIVVRARALISHFTSASSSTRVEMRRKYFPRLQRRSLYPGCAGYH